MTSITQMQKISVSYDLIRIRTENIFPFFFIFCAVGSQREELMELLVPVAANTEGADITEVSLAALALGMAFVGTCNDEVTFFYLMS